MKAILPVLIFFSVFLCSCAHKPVWTPQQRRALQMKSFNASYDAVFRSIKNILQDDGYIITNQDYKGGLILAHKEIDKSNSAAVMTVLFGYGNWESGKYYKISFNLEKISKRNVETRVTILQGTKRTFGGEEGSEVVDPKIYKAIYNKLNVELQRRIASGKN